MTAAHGVSQGPNGECSAANSCFGPGLTNSESGHTFLFTSVLTVNGIITGYTQNFPDNTSLPTAQRAILRWLPPDSVASPLTVENNGGSCGVYNITSPTLAKVLNAPAIADPSGLVGVELSYTDSNDSMAYSPLNIQDASISILPANTTTAC